jgi:flavin reductase (DIM6/NTAB) family NADH-FMN oxidoreductase RutF
MISRRVFVTGSSAVGLLSGMGAMSSPWLQTEGNNPKAQAATTGSRRALEQPGPMMPPMPAILLSINGVQDGPDEISVLWSFVLNGNPPQIGVSAGDEHIVRGLISQYQEFVLNVPTREMVDAFDVVDMNSSRVADKFALSGLTRGRATTVRAPTVEESPIHLECRVFDSLVVPPARTLFLADVLATSVTEGVCDAEGRLRVDSVPFFGMTAGSGEFYTMGEAIGHIGMSVGRDDIKY